MPPRAPRIYPDRQEHPTVSRGRKKLPPGPWDGEGDEDDWVAVPAGPLYGRIVRADMGTWGGYVGLPPDHPWHGLHHDRLVVSVHGGLTYSDWMERVDQEGRPIPSHPVRERLRDQHWTTRPWWIGFDCAHSNDLVPAYDAGEGRVMPGNRPFKTYRTEATAREWVNALASQAFLAWDVMTRQRKDAAAFLKHAEAELRKEVP